MTSFTGLRSTPLRRAVVPVVFALLAGCSASAGDPSASSASAIGAAGHARWPANVPTSYVATPYGYFDRSCVAQVSPGESAHPDGTIHRANGEVRSVGACNKPRFDPQGRPRVAGESQVHADALPASSSSYNGWLESYNASNVGSMSFLSATWVVPAAPASANDGQTVYFFNGLEGLPTVESILQPVLTFSGGHWTATSWNCCASGTTFTGNTIDVSPGDVIVGNVTGTGCDTSTGICNDWTIETLDQTTNQSSVLATSSWGVALNWVFPAVLEVYGVSTCSDLPASGSITFADQYFTTVTGDTSTSASWQLGLGSVSPSCGYGGQVSGSSVKLEFTGAGSVGVPTGAGNYSASCSGESLQSGHVLSASCKNVAGKSAATTLDLDTCVSNEDGSLSWQNGGNFGGSCTGCALSGSTLDCSCYEVSGQSNPATLDLDDHVSNCNGVLTCGACN